jgi:hypothetical protein
MDERAIKVLKKFQGDRSLNQYARDLNVDPGQLWRVINGEQGASSVLIKLIRTYPEHAKEIAAVLAEPAEVA